MPLQKVYSGNWNVLPLQENIAYLLARAGCDLDVKNSDGIAPCDFSEEPLEQILRCAKSLPFATMESLFLYYPMVTLETPYKEILDKFLPLLKQDQEMVIKQDEESGSCPFINSVPKKKRQRNLNSNAYINEESESEVKFDDQEESKIEKCPFLTKNDFQKELIADETLKIDSNNDANRCPFLNRQKEAPKLNEESKKRLQQLSQSAQSLSTNN